MYSVSRLDLILIIVPMSFSKNYRRCDKSSDLTIALLRRFNAVSKSSSEVILINILKSTTVSPSKATSR